MLYYIIPGTTSEEIDNEIINDRNVKEGNKHCYIYRKELYTRLLLSKQDVKFEKPNHMGVEKYEYYLLRTYIAILNQLLIDLGNVCDSKLCPKMTASQD
jgi:hypothetical protein